MEVTLEDLIDPIISEYGFIRKQPFLPTMATVVWLLYGRSEYAYVAGPHQDDRVRVRVGSTRLSLSPADPEFISKLRSCLETIRNSEPKL